jgi:hypothetical protein
MDTPDRTWLGIFVFTSSEQILKTASGEQCHVELANPATQSEQAANDICSNVFDK